MGQIDLNITNHLRELKYTECIFKSNVSKHLLKCTLVQYIDFLHTTYITWLIRKPQFSAICHESQRH